MLRIYCPVFLHRDSSPAFCETTKHTQRMVLSFEKVREDISFVGDIRGSKKGDQKGDERPMLQLPGSLAPIPIKQLMQVT